MLKEGAKETRQRTQPKKYPLVFLPMKIEEVKLEEMMNPGDQQMHNLAENIDTDFVQVNGFHARS